MSPAKESRIFTDTKLGEGQCFYPECLTRFAVTDEKLDEINRKLDAIGEFIKHHDEEHKLSMDDMQKRFNEIEKKLARQDVINTILGFVGGATVTALITIILRLKVI